MLLDGLKSKKAKVQQQAAQNIAIAIIKLTGKRQREFQDSMVLGVNALVKMAECDEADDPTEERRIAAFGALHRMLLYHKVSCKMAAETSIIKTIVGVLGKRKNSLELRTHASNVLNTIAANNFQSHQQMLTAGVIPCLIEYIQDEDEPKRTAHSGQSSSSFNAHTQVSGTIMIYQSLACISLFK